MDCKRATVLLSCLFVIWVFPPSCCRNRKAFSVVTVVFFSTACQQKGAPLVPVLALPACLASPEIPQFYSSLSGGILLRNTQICKRVYFWGLYMRDAPTGRVCTTYSPGWQSTLGATERIHKRLVAEMFPHFTTFICFYNPLYSMNCLQVSLKSLV